MRSVWLNSLPRGVCAEVLIFSLITLVFISDLFTQLGFVHGLLYTPLLVLAGLTSRIHTLNQSLLAAILLTWLAVLLAPAAPLGEHWAAMANRILTTAVLVAVYILCRFNIKFHREQEQQSHRLRLASQLANIGYWQLSSSNGEVTLSPEAATILEQPETDKLTASDFAGLFVPAEQAVLLKALYSEDPGEKILDSEYLLMSRQGKNRWLHIVTQPDPERPGTMLGILMDVSAMRSAQKDASRNRQHFEHLADTLPLYVWTATPDGKLDYISEDFMRYADTSLDYALAHWLEFLPESEREPTMQCWRRSLETGQPYVAEFRLRRADGEYLWHLNRALPVLNEQGRIVKWYGSSTNISDIKQLQQKSQQLNSQLQTTLNSITDAFFTIDESLHIQFANEQAHQLLNGAEQLPSKTRLAAVAFENASELSERLQQIMNKGRVDTFEFHQPDNQRCLEVRAYPSDHGLTVYMRDITQHREEQAELKLLRTALAQLNDIVIITKAEPLNQPGPEIVFVNEAFERITGYSREQAVGQTPRLLQGMKSERESLDRIRQALEQWQPVRAQVTNYTAEGREIILEINIVPLADDNGRYTHWVSVERDVTQEKSLEHQLQQAQRMEAIGQLTGGIAHDFNNLLTVITGNTDLLMEAMEGNPRMQALVKLVSDAAERGTGLTRNLLAFSRRQSLKPTSVSVNTLIENMESLLRSSLSREHILQLKLQTPLSPARVDAVQLESSLLNLTINARDAMPNGGNLLITTSETTLTPEDLLDTDAVQAGDYVCISITDTGEGISKNDVDKIFEPFFTTKPHGKGSGLGLSMVFGFIKQSGGHLHVDSAEGEGTTFQLYLPRSESADTIVETPSTMPRLQPDGSQTILLVEDNDLVRQSAVQQLREAGYEVLAAADASQAIEWLASKQRIDLLFTDIVMPGGMNGVELAEEARRMHPDLPVLLTSGYNETSDYQDNDLPAGMEMLTKPYRREVLLNHLTTILSQRMETTHGDPDHE